MEFSAYRRLLGAGREQGTRASRSTPELGNWESAARALRPHSERRPYRGLARRIMNWPLMSLQQRLVKTGGRLIKHARYCWLLLLENHLTRPLFGTCGEGLRPSHHQQDRRAGDRNRFRC
jgi:hypothetical protein